MKRILLSTMLLAAVSANVFAGGTEDMGSKPIQHAEPAMPVAAASCEGPAVKEGQWTFSARAGIAPTAYGKSARITHTYGNPQRTNFKETYSVKSHNLPFTTGVDIGYAVMDNVEAFFNFDYAHAGGKKRKVITQTTTFLGNTSIRTTNYKQGNFNSYGFYLGGRYFFDLESKFSPFVGAKLGLLHRTHGKHTVTDKYVFNGVTTDIDKYTTPLFKNSTAFSAGLQLGGNYCLNEQVSLFVMSEFIGSTKPKTNNKRTLVLPQDELYSKVTRRPGASFSFPITAGIKVRM